MSFFDSIWVILQHTSIRCFLVNVIVRIISLPTTSLCNTIMSYDLNIEHMAFSNQDTEEISAVLWHRRMSCMKMKIKLYSLWRISIDGLLVFRVLLLLTSKVDLRFYIKVRPVGSVQFDLPLGTKNRSNYRDFEFMGCELRSVKYPWYWKICSK